MSAPSSANQDPYSDIHRYLRRLRRQEQLDEALILHYDPASCDLRPWLWPVNEAGERVTPEGLSDHRTSHAFRGPCCLCAVVSNDNAAYTEAAIFKAFDGEFVGEYMAGCADGRCGYIVAIERLYALLGLPVKRYPPLDAHARVPAPVVHVPTILHIAAAASTGRLKPRSKKYTRRGILGIVPKRDPPREGAESCFSMLVRLDSWTEPGLSEAEFHKLFIKCRRCRRIMTREAFEYHNKCALTHPDVIDLTADD